MQRSCQTMCTLFPNETGGQLTRTGLSSANIVELQNNNVNVNSGVGESSSIFKQNLLCASTFAGIFE